MCGTRGLSSAAACGIDAASKRAGRPAVGCRALTDALRNGVEGGNGEATAAEEESDEPEVIPDGVRRGRSYGRWGVSVRGGGRRRVMLCCAVRGGHPQRAGACVRDRLQGTG